MAKKHDRALTAAEKAAYVKHRYGSCPYCGKGNIEGESYDGDGNTIGQDVSCPDCGRAWTDVYTLTDIVEKGTDG